jgi:alpha-ribazole phosphatase
VIRRYERGIRASCARGARDIHLVRHGAIQSGEEPKRFIGQLDLPLNEEGLAQAEHLRSVLSGVALSAVYCSDLKRSIQTAAIIARDHGLSCIPKPELREIALGQWEGLTFDEVRQQYPREFEARGRDIVHFHPPGGESFLDCTCRVIPALHEILHETRGSILIVAHAGVNRIILSELLERSLEDLFSIGQDYGCLSVVRQKRSRFELSAIDSFKY